VPEPAPGEMIVLDLGNQRWLERLPLAHAVTELRAGLARAGCLESGD